jgi:type I restriction enzyme R subunit
VVFDDAAFREYVDTVRRKYEQIIDTANTDQVTFAGFSAEATDKAQETVSHFREFLKEHRDSLTALQIYYSQPYRRKELTFAMVQEVAEALQRPPYNLTTNACGPLRTGDGTEDRRQPATPAHRPRGR